MRTNTFVAAIGGLIVGVIGVVIALVLKDIFFPPLPLGPCTNPNDHCIDVKVIDVRGQPQIQSIPDEKVPVQGAIFWIIRTSGYSFPSNGIDFTNPGGNPPKPVAPSGEFKNCQPLPDTNPPTKFKCEDTYHTKGTFGYKVTVTGVANPLDPFIINN